MGESAVEVACAVLRQLEEGLEQCRDGLLLVDEASALIQEADNQLRTALAPTSRAFRIYDRDTQRTVWWPGRQKYLAPDGCGNLQSRITVVRSVITELERDMRKPAHRAGKPPEPTGWERVDRSMARALEQIERAETEEEHQAVGLYCRETLISLGQAVYDSERHTHPDGIEPSSTDAARMLEAFIATELRGGSNEALRSFIRSALKLANDLQHRRTASYRNAALCVEATATTVNAVAIVANQE